MNINNIWHGIIRLTKDPEIKYTQDGKAVARFDGACAKFYKKEGEPDADFFSFIAFGKTAEFVEKYARKGIKFNIVAEVKNNNWTDKDNVKHYSTQFNVEMIGFAESKSNSPTQDEPKPDSNGFVDMSDTDDMPFH